MARQVWGLGSVRPDLPPSLSGKRAMLEFLDFQRPPQVDPPPSSCLFSFLLPFSLLKHFSLHALLPSPDLSFQDLSGVGFESLQESVLAACSPYTFLPRSANEIDKMGDSGPRL